MLKIRKYYKYKNLCSLEEIVQVTVSNRKVFGNVNILHQSFLGSVLTMLIENGNYNNNNDSEFI